MGILSFLGDIISPVTKLIDNIHTSEGEKQELKNSLFSMEAALTGKVLEYETKLVQAQASIIKAEATGHSWLQRNWRPGLMALFGFIVFNNYVLAPYLLAIFGSSVALELPPDMWTLMKIGLGGYVIGRSAEKGIEKWKG